MKTLISYVGRLGSGKGYCMMQEVERLKTTGNSIYMVSFADPIKQILRNAFGLTKNGRLYEFRVPQDKEYVKRQIENNIHDYLTQCYGKNTYKKTLVTRHYEFVENDFYNFICNAQLNIDYDYSFRRLAQLLGTEIGRYCSDSIWIDIAFDQVNKVFAQNLADYAFIDDCRFLNEYEAIAEFAHTSPYDAKVIGVYASDETRASRRNLTLEELKSQDTHGSEKEIEDIIKILPKERVIINE